MSESTIINLKKDIDLDLVHTINIINLNWQDYHHIMMGIDNLIIQLSKSIHNTSLEEHRLELLKNYQTLFDNLQSMDIPWKGKAESLSETVIIATRAS